MKIRLVSDLHLDINRKYNVEIPNNDVFTLIAGDLGGDYKANAEWLKKNVRQGAFISGNHDAYTPDNTPVDDVKEFYHENFSIDGPITYFDDDVGVISKEIDDKTLLIADVLYTDYKLKIGDISDDKGVSERIKRNMFLAEPKFSGSYMNDFRFFTRKGTYKKSEFGIQYERCPEGCFYIRAKNYKEHFDRVFKKITKLVEENSDKNIILMTHHCLSKGCISEEYSKDTLNASYVSDKDSWIRKHPNIRLVFSGHMHTRKDFMVGKNTRYMLNPLGYLRNFENCQFNGESNAKEYWTPDLFIDTETWKVTRNEYVNEEWDKLQNKSLAYASMFI